MINHKDIRNVRACSTCVVFLFVYIRLTNHNMQVYRDVWHLFVCTKKAILSGHSQIGC